MIGGKELEGAQCAVHADAAAAVACERCGSFACSACVISDPRGKTYCRNCGPAALRATYFWHTWAIRFIGAVYLVLSGMMLLAWIQLLPLLNRLIAKTPAPLESSRLLGFGTAVIAVLGLAAYMGITGWKLRAFRPAARFFGLVPLVVMLFAFPIGSLLGLSGVLLLLGPGGRFVFANEYTHTGQKRVLGEVVAWFFAVVLPFAAALVEQYGSISNVISSWSK